MRGIIITENELEMLEQDIYRMDTEIGSLISKYSKEPTLCQELVLLSRINHRIKKKIIDEK